MLKFAHLNIITDDWQTLANFYINVFNCKPVYPKRDLRGKWLDKLTAIDDAHLTGIHLKLPGYRDNGPTLEIFQYDSNEENLISLSNRKGFGHIAFKVDDVQETLNNIIAFGGSLVGELVKTKIGDGTATLVYAKDIDGNIIELQHWNV